MKRIEKDEKEEGNEEKEEKKEEGKGGGCFKSARTQWRLTFPGDVDGEFLVGDVSVSLAEREGRDEVPPGETGIARAILGRLHLVVVEEEKSFLLVPCLHLGELNYDLTI